MEDFDPATGAKGGHILLITDGREDLKDPKKDPTVASVTEKLLSEKVLVHAILSGGRAEQNDQILSLSTRSGGRSFFDSGDEKSDELLSSLIAVAKEISGDQTVDRGDTGAKTQV